MKDPNFAIAFTIGKYTIYWYAVLLALGIVAALVILDRRTRGRALPKDIALDLCILGVPFGVLGARLFACLSGAVCGDHCSPISDTTIMASAGAQCDHVTHVSTQLPYALTVAGVSFVAYILSGFVPNAVVVLPIAIAMMILTLFLIRLVKKPS